MHANIRLGWKGLTVANALAYYISAKITTVKCFIVHCCLLRVVVNFCKKSLTATTRTALFYLSLIIEGATDKVYNFITPV